MTKNKAKRYLEVFLRCPTCTSLIRYDAYMCEYCGNLISYDNEVERYYVSGRACFKCGFSNDPESLFCAQCKTRFSILCPKCKEEIEIERDRCEHCGLQIKKFRQENEVLKYNTLEKSSGFSKWVLCFGAMTFFAFFLFFAFLAILDRGADVRKTVLFSAGSVIFLVLFILVIKGRRVNGVTH